MTVGQSSRSILTGKVGTSSALRVDWRSSQILLSTKIKLMTLNKIFPFVLIGIIVLAGSPFLLGLIWPRINDVKTGATPQYADLQPQRFTQPPEKVFAAALEVSQAQGWEIRESKPEQGIIEAVATTRLFKFKDDVTITITSEGGSTIVNVRSKSRIGKGDMGTNARRIRTFQAELAKKL